METKSKDNVVEAVRQRLLDRSNIGFKKYGTTLAENNKDNYLNHMYEEALDFCNYLQKKLMQNEDITQLVKQYPNDQELGNQIRLRYGN